MRPTLMHFIGLIGKFLAIILLINLVLIVGYWLPAIFSSDHHERNARMTQCMSNQKQIALAVAMYTQEHDAHLPGLAAERTKNTSSTWRAVIGVPDKVYNCTSSGRDGSTVMPITKTTGPELGMNASLYGVDLNTIFAPESTILTADATANGIVSPNDFTSPHNDKKGLVASFCDGHVEYLITANLPKAARRVGGAYTPALFRPGVISGGPTIHLTESDFSPYLLTGGNGLLLTLTDRAHSTALAGVTLPKHASLRRGKTVVLKIGDVAAGEKSSVAYPVSWAAGEVSLLDYYDGKPAPGVVPAQRYGLAAGDYRVGSFAVIAP